MYLVAQVTLLQCFGFSHTFFWHRKEPNCYLCCCCGVDAFTFRRSVECNMNEWTESCRACCHFPLYMLCSCHALTNPAGPLFDTLPSTCLLMCLRTFRVRSQWQNWLIVSFMLMCLLNPVNVWSCVQNKCYVSTFPLLHSRCKNAWVCKSLALLIWSYLPLISALFLPLKVRRDLCRRGQLPSPSEWVGNRRCIQGYNKPFEFIPGTVYIRYFTEPDLLISLNYLNSPEASTRILKTLECVNKPRAETLKLCWSLNVGFLKFGQIGPIVWEFNMSKQKHFVQI